MNHDLSKFFIVPPVVRPADNTQDESTRSC